MSSNLIRRLLVAAIGIPAAVAFVYLDGWALAGLISLFAVVGTAEVYRLAGRAGIAPLEGLGFVGALAFPLWVHAGVVGLLPSSLLWGALTVTGWGVAVMAVTTLRRAPEARPLEAAAVTIFGAAYAGGLPAFLLVLRQAHGAPDAAAATAVVFLPLVVVWVCDTAAMAIGFAVGGPKLAPVLSPKKTWSGAIGGTIAAVLVAPAYGALVLRPLGVALGPALLALFGLVISIVGQSGDVSESLFKRQVGVKDSGAFFPGHGGVLDRFDALYWALPVAAAILALAGVL